MVALEMETRELSGRMIMWVLDLYLEAVRINYLVYERIKNVHGIEWHYQRYIP